jgi:hypothetical protein
MRAELFFVDHCSRNAKEGVFAYYYCDLCDTTTKQQRSPFAIPELILCRYCDTNERNM